MGLFAVEFTYQGPKRTAGNRISQSNSLGALLVIDIVFSVDFTLSSSKKTPKEMLWVKGTHPTPFHRFIALSQQPWSPRGIQNSTERKDITIIRLHTISVPVLVYFYHVILPPIHNCDRFAKFSRFKPPSLARLIPAHKVSKSDCTTTQF